MTRKAKRSASSLVSRYLDLLAEEGYRPQVVSDDDGPTIVNFEAEGERFLLLLEEADPQFFHLGSAWELGEADLAAAIHRANDLNEELKGVKLTVWAPDRSVRVHVEAFVEEGPVSLSVLDRSVSAIRNAARKFFEPVRAPDRLDA